jgi:cytochrome c551/c552
MNFISNLINTPTQEHLLLNHYIIIAISLIFLTYTGILFGSVFLSMVYFNRSRSEENPFFLKLAKDLASTFIGKKSTGVILGIIPSFVLLVAYSQILYGSSILISQYFLYIFLFITASVVFAHLYRNSLLNDEKSGQIRNLWGGLTLIGLFLMIFTFISSTGLILFPSSWTLVRAQIPVFFDFNVAVRFFIFFAAAFAVTGSAIIFFYFNWGGGKENLDKESRDYVTKLGGGLSLVFTLILPLLIVWNFKTIPPLAETYTAYWVAAAALVLLLIIANLLYLLLKNSNVNYGSSIFVLFIITLLVMTVNDNIARDQALTQQGLILSAKADEVEAQIKMEQEQAKGTGEADIVVGEQIFNSKCIACHRFDQKLVGPAYKDVLPQFENDMDALVNFILNPRKVNPDFPAMPNQGLKPQEARAVAKYIMHEYQTKFK